MGTNGTEMVAPQAGALVKESFGGRQLSVQAETTTAAVAAQAQAMVQARFIMAERKPRDMDEVRVRLLKECKRPGFAQKAIYHKPIGKGVEGPSIRLIETVMRLMGNILGETPTTYDDPKRRIVRVMVTDLETNTTYQTDIVVEKTVERSTLREGQEALAERVNSYGKATYVVEATEDDMLNKQNNLISKALRTNGQRLIPADVLEEAMFVCRATSADETARNPAMAKNKLVDGFAAMGVSPAQLKAYLEHELDASTPAELATLRGIYAALAEGETTWKSVMAAKAEAVVAPPPPAAAQPAPTSAAPATVAPASAAPSAPPASPPGGAAMPAPPGNPAVATAGAGVPPTPAPAVADPPPAPPAGDDPDSFTDRLIAQMRAAADVNALKALAAKAKECPRDLQDKVGTIYAEAMSALKAKANGSAK